MNSVCDRCKSKVRSLRMSRFNTEMCCIKCITKEKAHKDYQKAYDAELEECKKGNLNFEGIGLPKDLEEN